MKLYRIWLAGRTDSICSFSVIGDSIGRENKRMSSMGVENPRIIKKGDEIIAFVPVGASVQIEEIKP